MQFVGELAALSTAALWSVTSICFSEAGKRIGSFKVNKIRLLLAVILYSLVLWITTGSLLPPDITTRQLFWLGLSGFIGLVIGDSALFKAFVLLGPRLTTLIFASSPIMTTIIAWYFLSEQLNIWALLGIVVTISGISWVVAERRYTAAKDLLPTDHPDSGSYAGGVVYALVGSLGQAVGLVFAKEGMLGADGVVDPLPASFVRMCVALVTIWLISAARGQLRDTVKAMGNPGAMGFTLAGAFVGPFLGVWMSLVALSYIAAGIAATLNAMVPVLVIPLVIWLYKERVSPRALIGALVAVAGVALLFLR